MALETQVINFPFIKGEETKIDPALVDQGSLLGIINGYFGKTGSITRRDAWVSLSGASITSPWGACSYGNELLAVAGKTLYSYSSGRAAMTSRGTVSPCSITRQSVQRATDYADNIDAATSGGFTCYVWRKATGTAAFTFSYGSVYALIVDESTGAVVYGATALSASPTAMAPRVVGLTATSPSDAAAFLIAWVDGTNIKAAAIQHSNMTLSAVINAATDNVIPASLGPLDMISMGGTGVLVHRTTNVTFSTHALMLKYSGGSVSVASGPAGTSTQANIARADVVGLAIASYSSAKIGVFANVASGGLWAGTLDATASTIALSVSMAQKDATGTGVTPAVTGSTIVAALNGSTMTVYADALGDSATAGTGVVAAGIQRTIRTFGINSANTVTSAAATFVTSYIPQSGMAGPWIAGKPVVSGGAVYLPVFVAGATNVSTAHNAQNTWFLLDSSGVVVGKALVGNFGVYMASWPSNGVPTTLTTSAGFACIAPERGILSMDGVQNSTPVGICRLNLNFSPKFSTAQVGKAQFFAGGVVTQYDGVNVSEAGFHFFPEDVNTSLVGAGALTGSYQYCALYEWFDSTGQRHQSAPSVPVSVSPAAQNVTVRVPVLGLTSKTGVQVVIYRTVASGSTFYRVNGPNVQLGNTPAAGEAVISYTDSASDATIQGNEILYTTGGAIENIGPGSASVVAAHQSRLWLGGLEDPSEYRISQEVVVQEGLYFSDELTGNIPQDAGAISAIGVLDDKAILYTNTRKFVVFGQGPNVAGLQGSYSTPQMLPSDTGCIDCRSLVNIPTGQMYQSRHGIYLLNRALQDEYIGGPVETTVLNATISAAVNLQDRAQVRFCLPNALANFGRVLVYDTLAGQWSEFRTSNISGCSMTGACAWNGYFTYADNTRSTMGQDSVGTYQDFASTAITLSISTPWYRLGALSGFQRVRRLVLRGAYGSAATVQAAVRTNYETGAQDYLTTAWDTSTAQVNNSFQLRHHIAKQKCTAIEFVFTDTPSATNYSGSSFSGITLEIAVKRGAAKPPTGATV